MKTLRESKRLAIVGLVLIGLVAAALSVMALFQHRAPREVLALPGAGPTSTAPSATSSQEPDSPTPTASLTPSATASQTPARVVVIGDSYSLGDDSATWVGDASKELGWPDVVNLSARSRGFVKKPRTCDMEPCATFTGSVELIAAENPTLVITFGGSADGDGDIGAAAEAYFAALRDALPDAELVAINPLTTRDEAPAWLERSAGVIESAVTAVGGRFIDVGQPGLGDGQTLSADAQAEIGRLVVESLAKP